ncbi:unnamed protein product, partial [Brassica rapa]
LLRKESPTPPSAAVIAVSKPILTVALILLFIYLTLGVVTYTSIPNQFSGTKTNVIVDSLYFSIVTLATVGYGDIAPSTTKSKVLTMVLIIIGFFSLEYLLNRVVTHLLDLQEKAVMACIKTPLIVEEGRIKTKWKMCFAILALVLCVIVAALFLYRYEKLDLVDSVYLSLVSVATVGYGDKAFETLVGRVFAVCWILASSVSVTSFFYYFAETRIGGSVMHESKAENGKAEFILLKLLEAEKISEDDIKQVLEEYERSG